MRIQRKAAFGSGLRKRGRAVALMLVGAAAAALSPGVGLGQGVRGWVGTNVQAVRMRPMVLDTIPPADIQVQGDGTLLYQGQPVECSTPELCTLYGTGAMATAWAATEDLSLTAWGLGMQGLSVTTLLRARSDLGSEFVWPRTDRNFEALLAYAQLVRGPVRIRAGRQEIRGGLGFPAFDGGDVLYARRSLSVEAYGGRSLERGLRQPADEALQGLDPYLIDQSSYLFGGSLRAIIGQTTLAYRYQREILADRSGLVSERSSLDLTAPVPYGRLSGSMDYDYAFRQFGKGHLTYSVPIDQGRWLVEAAWQRYRPYFDLSTIWGFFEPVAYNGGNLRATWSARPTLGVWASGGYRKYEDTHTTEVLQPLTGHGWQAEAGVRWMPAHAWFANAEYNAEFGPGGFMQSGDVSVRYSPSEKWGVTASGQTFQQIEEFRVGDGRALGGGLSFDVGFGGRARFTGGFSVLRHRDGGTATLTPWDQTRGWSSLRINVGEDPGLANRRGS